MIKPNFFAFPAGIAAVWFASFFLAGCPPPCEAEGLHGLAGFDLACGEISFLGSEDALLLSFEDTTDGVLDMEMPFVTTMGTGLRFENGGEWGLEGVYHSENVSVAPVDETYILITDWEAVTGQDYNQLVAIEFFVEVEPVSTFIGGTLEGTATGIQVFTND